MTETATKTPRRIRILLIASLAVNLLFVGLLVGAVLRGDHDHPSRGTDVNVPGDLRGLARAMPERPRKALREAIEARPELGRDRRSNIRENRQLFVQALEADPFELEAIDTIFVEQRALFTAIAQNGQDALLEAIEMMTPEERASFVENLRKAKPPRGSDGARRR